MSSTSHSQRSSPELIFETLNAYQRTAALKAAIELDIFTAIGEGASTVAEIAHHSRASGRGIRALCDYLVVLGFLTKQIAVQEPGQGIPQRTAPGQSYALTADSSKFLDRRSPFRIASTIGFLALPTMTDAFKNFADVVRSGQPHVAGGAGTTGPEDPIWIDFAIAMAPMQAPLAEFIAKIVSAEGRQKWKVLDIAAGPRRRHHSRLEQPEGRRPETQAPKARGCARLAAGAESGARQCEFRRDRESPS